MLKLAAATLSLLLLGCSSCAGNNNGKNTDTGTDGDADSDSDSDSDSDADGDSDSDSDTETDSGTGNWEWTDLPGEDDCEGECEQLTFEGEVKIDEWDVWGDHLIYNADDVKIRLVDITASKVLEIPNRYPAHPIGTMTGHIHAYPSIDGEFAY